MTRGSVAAKVAANKEQHPERFCPVKRCLWRTGGPYCPRHEPKDVDWPSCDNCGSTALGIAIMAQERGISDPICCETEEL